MLTGMIKIDPKIFEGSESLTDTFGDLGYPGLFRHVVFEIIRSEKSGRDNVYVARITNPDKLKALVGAKGVKSEGDWVILQKDAVRANTKVTLDYEIASPVDNSKLVEELFAQRKKLRSQGKDKKHKDMLANWKKIQAARGEIKDASETELVDVTLPKHTTADRKRLVVKVKRGMLPKEGDELSLNKFHDILLSEIVKLRASRKVTTPETRVVHDVAWSMLAGVHTEAGQPAKSYENFIRNAFEIAKSPTDKKATYVGIEIEMVYQGNMETLKKLMFAEQLHRNVTITRDDSVRSCHNQGYAGIELNVLVKREEAKSVLERLQRVFNNPAVDAYANRSCGLHIHGDMRNRDHKLVYKNLVRVQDILRGCQPSGRVRNMHCRPNTTDVFKATGADTRDTRYWVINPEAYSDHTTLEVRVHEGTTDCESIYNWVVFLDTIMSHTKEIPTNKYKLASELAAGCGLSIPEGAMQYVDSRVKRFNSLSVG